MHFVVTFGNLTNGWSSTAAYPNFGDDYWFRATANFGGIWWNSSNEAVYELLHVDANGNPTTGDTTYQLTFTADQLPNRGRRLLLVTHRLRQTGLHARPQTQPDATTSAHAPAWPSTRTGRLLFSSHRQRPADVPESNWLPTPPTRPSPPIYGFTSPRGSPHRHLVTTASRAHLVTSNALTRCPRCALTADVRATCATYLCG